jgi:hypothetical protein
MFCWNVCKKWFFRFLIRITVTLIFRSFFPTLKRELKLSYFCYYRVVKGECVYGIQTVHYLPPANCIMPSSVPVTKSIACTTRIPVELQVWLTHRNCPVFLLYLIVQFHQFYTLTYLLTHSLTYSLTYLLTHSLTYLLTHSLTYSLTYLLTHLLTHSLTYSLTYSPTYLLTHSLNHLLTHSLTYSLTYLLTHSLTYLLTYLLTYSLTFFMEQSPWEANRFSASRITRILWNPKVH